MDIKTLRPPLSKMPHQLAFDFITTMRADRMVSKVRARKVKKEAKRAKITLMDLAENMSKEELGELMERLGKASVKP